MFNLENRLSSWLILRENKGISATKSKDKITVTPINNSALNHIPYSFPIIGKDAIKIAATGVGNPIKEVVCLVSILNFARRIAEKRGIKKAINDGKKSGWDMSD